VRSRAVKVLVDTGPLVAAIDRRDASHKLAALLIARLRRDAVVPSPVLVEVDHLARNRVGKVAARKFLKATAGGQREIAYLSAGLLRRAVELDNQYADLNLGFVDTCVMAIAERHELPILTFDFADFRATESAAGPWRLAIDEHTYQRIVSQ
jgi:predicted nucleic acid-binding protein